MLAVPYGSPDYRNANRVVALNNRHKLLESKIAQEAKRPLPDGLAIRGLKKQRLLLKEELAALQATD